MRGQRSAKMRPEMTGDEVRLARGRGRKRGSAVVEFALAAIILFAFMFGIMDFCRAVYAYEFVTYAARQGARYASVRGSQSCQNGVSSPTNPFCATATQIQTYVQSLNLPGIDPGQITANTLWYTGTGCPTGTGVPVNSPGCPVKVVVAYNYSSSIPFLRVATITMRASSTMVISQ